MILIKMKTSLGSTLFSQGWASRGTQQKIKINSQIEEQKTTNWFEFGGCNHVHNLHGSMSLAGVKNMALKLTAIINSHQTKQAIINGMSFEQGQKVQGYKVILITKSHVVLDGSDGTQTLFINNNDIKKDIEHGF